jgi:hypothetical protein
MTPLWALAFILFVVIMLFVVLPRASQTALPTQAIVRTPPIKTTHADADAERCIDREMLKSFYPPPLTPDIPVDYPKKAIGACPDSKAQAHALPPANIPMYAF